LSIGKSTDRTLNSHGARCVDSGARAHAFAHTITPAHTRIQVICPACRVELSRYFRIVSFQVYEVVQVYGGLVLAHVCLTNPKRARVFYTIVFVGCHDAHMNKCTNARRPYLRTCSREYIKCGRWHARVCARVTTEAAQMILEAKSMASTNSCGSSY
jgi:hypothetical protein